MQKPPENRSNKGDTLLVAGVDEVGIGPLAGPVLACAVILDPDQPRACHSNHQRKAPPGSGRRDSQQALCVSLGRASVEEIDEMNVLKASHLAMRRALAGLSIKPDHVLVDGNKLPDTDYSAEAIVQGDKTVEAISAASIVAKVTRDQELINLAQLYPGYGFESHKGYPTARHRWALRTMGPCPAHRRSYAPVQAALARTLATDE